MVEPVDFPKRLGIGWLKSEYSKGRLSPSDVAEEIVKRADRYADYNVWITPPDLESMMVYIRRLPEDSGTLPLWGIPFAIKDNIDLAGVPTTAGCPAYSYVPAKDATVVGRLIAAGAVPVGKTNMDQFATGLVGVRSPYGETKNAIRPELISGGSSSGSAVATALGMASFSLGTDTAGSGRVPALLNGLVGLKTSIGAWSAKGVVPACESLDCVSVFADNLADAREVDKAARGYDGGYRYTRKLELKESRKPEKILLPEKEPEFYGTYGPLYRENWQNAVKKIQGLCIPVEYVDYSMFSKAASILYDGPWVAERWCALGDFVTGHPGEIFPVTERILRSGSGTGMTAASVFEAMHELAGYKVRARELLAGNVLVMPTAGGTFTREQVDADPIAANSSMGLYTNHCNLLDLAAAAVPMESIDETLPFGVTIFAEYDREDVLYGAAEMLLEE